MLAPHLRPLCALVIVATAFGCGDKAVDQPVDAGGFTAFALKSGEAKELSFTLESEGFAVLELTGHLTGSSWKTAGAESIVARLVVDGKVLRHAIWVTGEQELAYGVHVGKLAAGAHTVEVTFDAALSRASAATWDVSAGRLYLPEDQTLARYAPIIFAPEASTSTDLGFVTYGGKGADGTLRYNLFYTNEDDGTGVSPPLLQARWGRLSDIEWLMETELDAAGNATVSRYQGAFHGTVTFSGIRDGDAPVLKIGPNGTFEQAVGSGTKLKLSPVVYPWLPVGEPRERLMEKLPYLHRLTDEESEREGKIDPTCGDAAKLWPGRCQLLVDLDVTATVALAGRRVWGLELTSSEGTVRSELSQVTPPAGQPALGAISRQDRTGSVRIALPLKPGVTPTALKLYAVDDGQGAFSITARKVRAIRVDAAQSVSVVFDNPAAEATVSESVSLGGLYP